MGKNKAKKGAPTPKANEKPEVPQEQTNKQEKPTPVEGKSKIYPICNLFIHKDKKVDEPVNETKAEA